MRVVLFGLLLLTLACQPVRATAYTYSTSVDLSSPSVQPGGQYEAFTFVLPASQPSFDLAVGDTLSGTVSFDQAMTFTNSNMFATTQNLRLVFTDATSDTLGSSQSVQLQGISGSLTIQNPEVTTDSGTDSLFAINLIGTPTFTQSSLSFTGFTYSMTVTDESASGVSFTPQYLTVMTGVGDFSVAPEPSTWAMMLLGVGVLTIGLRRHSFLDEAKAMI